jgi:hypothetical protein
VFFLITNSALYEIDPVPFFDQLTPEENGLDALDEIVSE